jgi:hypothetical protein
MVGSLCDKRNGLNSPSTARSSPAISAIVRNGTLPFAAQARHADTSSPFKEQSIRATSQPAVRRYWRAVSRLSALQNAGADSGGSDWAPPDCADVVMYPRRILEAGSFRTLRAVQRLRRRGQRCHSDGPARRCCLPEILSNVAITRLGRGHARQKQFRVTIESPELMGPCGFSSVLMGRVTPPSPLFIYQPMGSSSSI